MIRRINAIVLGVALVAAGWFGRQLIPTGPSVRTEGVGYVSFDNGRRPVVNLAGTVPWKTKCAAGGGVIPLIASYIVWC